MFRVEPSTFKVTVLPIYLGSREYLLYLYVTMLSFETVLVIPTYINKDSKSANVAAKLLELIGADFKRQFSLESYKAFSKNGI